VLVHSQVVALDGRPRAGAVRDAGIADLDRRAGGEVRGPDRDRSAGDPVAAQRAWVVMFIAAWRLHGHIPVSCAADSIRTFATVTILYFRSIPLDSLCCEDAIASGSPVCPLVYGIFNEWQ
jgi:hypothetical protein